MNKISKFCAHLVPAILLCSATANAGDVVRANNTNLLNVNGAWLLGVQPTSSDVAVWDSTITADRSSTIGAASALTWQGIRIGATTGGTLMTIGGVVGSTLDIGSAGIDMSGANVDLSINALMNFSSPQSWSIANGRTLSISPNASNIYSNTGSAAIDISGPGSIALGNGTIHFGTGTLTLGGGIRLRSNGGTGRTITNSFVLDGDMGVGSTAVAGAISLTGASIDLGGATRVINIQNSVTDGSATALNIGSSTSVVSVSNGALSLANGNASGTVRVFLGSTSGSFVPVISADVIIGANVLAVMPQTNSFGTSPTTDLTVDGRLRMGNLASAKADQVVQSLSGSGLIDSGQGSGSNAPLLTINGGAGTGTTTYSGVIENGGFGQVLITKAGSTTQVFSGANTYTGKTAINGGTLLINGTHIDSAAVTAQGYGSATDGHFNVASGATLGGTGRIAGNNSQANSNMIYVQSGGHLAPGASIGKLTLDGANISGAGAEVLNMASGSVFDFELAGNGGTPDQLAFWNYVGGDFVLNSNALNLTISGGIVAGTYTVDLFQFFSDAGATATASGIGSGLVLGTLGAGIDSANIIYNANTISLQYTTTTIPEPSTYAMLMSGLGLLALLRRRSKSSV
jgi:fibronectin-binding autotransporter adhesin